MTLLLALACTTPWITETVTDDGGWTVSIPDDAVTPGEVTLPLTVRSDTHAIDGLVVTAVAGMADMTHAHADATVEEEGSGVYQLTLDLGMEGVWTLEGTLDDGEGPEGFQLQVEALGGR